MSTHNRYHRQFETWHTSLRREQVYIFPDLFRKVPTYADVFFLAYAYPQAMHAVKQSVQWEALKIVTRTTAANAIIL